MRCPHCEKSNFWRNPLNTKPLLVCSECKIDMRATVAISRPRNIVSCNYYDEGNEFIKQLAWSKLFFDNKHDRCYCRTCYSDNQPNTLRVAEASYVVPRGWAGFGLGVDPFRAENLWDTWIVVYHGTNKLAAQSILDHRQFLLPGDTLLDGTQLQIRPGHISGQNHIYTSPSIRYASLEVYAPVYSFRSPKTGKRYNVQIVLQCKQKTETFCIQGQTVQDDDHVPICNIVPNDVIEHYTTRRSSVIPYRLLVRLENAY